MSRSTDRRFPISCVVDIGRRENLRSSLAGVFESGVKPLENISLSRTVSPELGLDLRIPVSGIMGSAILEGMRVFLAGVIDRGVRRLWKGKESGVVDWSMDLRLRLRQGVGGGVPGCWRGQWIRLTTAWLAKGGVGVRAAV